LNGLENQFKKSGVRIREWVLSCCALERKSIAFDLPLKHIVFTSIAKSLVSVFGAIVENVDFGNVALGKSIDFATFPNVAER